MLRSGGNAVDAAVAVGYALAVVYPAAGNIGGGGFMLVRLADGREVFVDFRERAPKAATADMFLDASGNPDAARSTLGHLAVAVPGTVAGLELAREKYGTRKRRDLIAPAIVLAERGFVLEAGDVAMFEEARCRGDVEGEPSPASFDYGYGRALVESGEVERGRALLRGALANDPRNPHAKRSRALLD